jgi:hypothetical protein
MKGCFPTASMTRPANATPFAAYDAVGDTGGSAIMTFSNICNDAARMQRILQVNLDIYDSSAIPSGMANFILALYSASPTAIADNAVWGIVSGDRATNLGMGLVNIGAPTILGTSGTQHSCVENMSHIFKPASTAIYGILVTVGAYTPVSSSVYKVTLFAQPL